LVEAKPANLRTRPARRLADLRPPLGPRHFARLALAAEFSRAITKPSGRVAQIGDNDSGRFFKLHPIFAIRSAAEARLFYANLEAYDGLAENAVYLDEETLDHRPTIAAIGMLLGRRDLVAFANGPFLDEIVVAALCNGRVPAADATALDEAAARRHRAHGSTTMRAERPARIIEIMAPGGDLREGLQRQAFADFGLWIFRSPRLLLTVRCGPIGHGGRGAHAHNDQLAIELTIDGEDWIADPGSYLYTPSRSLRNAYRSVMAHYAPQDGTREPGRLDLGDFWLGDEADAQCIAFDDTGFTGEHRGFGMPVRRTIIIGSAGIIIEDSGEARRSDTETIRCLGRRDFLARFPVVVPFSPGYGKRYRHPAMAQE
jgi:hypothetical protein